MCRTFECTCIAVFLIETLLHAELVLVFYQNVCLSHSGIALRWLTHSLSNHHSVDFTDYEYDFLTPKILVKFQGIHLHQGQQTLSN